MKPKNKAKRLEARRKHYDTVIAKLKNTSGYHRPGSQKK
jgi:hypothetical protein